MPPDLLIRPARPGDRDDLGALKLRASLAWGDHVRTLQALPEAREVELELMAACFLAERAGQIVGYGAVVPGEGRRAELEDLFVDPVAWRTGVGRALLEEAARRGAAQGARLLRVVAGARAVGFYEACGFERLGPIETPLETALLMQRPCGS